jgi:hypothetical protein
MKIKSLMQFYCLKIPLRIHNADTTLQTSLSFSHTGNFTGFDYGAQTATNAMKRKEMAEPLAFRDKN